MNNAEENEEEKEGSSHHPNMAGKPDIGAAFIEVYWAKLEENPNPRCLQNPTWTGIFILMLHLSFLHLFLNILHYCANISDLEMM